MPIAFLNRFEKQLISYRTSLSSETEPWISKIEERLAQVFGVASKQLDKLFCGFNDDTIPSALFNILVERKEEQKSPDAFDQNEPKNPELDDATVDAIVDLFKPLCNPETILEVAVDQGEKFDYEKAEQKEFPSFRKVIELQQMESNKQMALILTGDFECNLPVQWNYATKKIASFKKSIDFEQTIYHFFSSDNTTQDLLILQYVHDPKNVSHFMHIKHTLEHAHYQYYCCNEEGKDQKEDNKDEEKKQMEQRLVVLLVHIKPPIFKNPFPLIFSRKWKFTYVDNLSLVESVQLKTLLSQTMSDVLKNDESNTWLRNAIRRAFARLQFPTQKNGGRDIQRLLTLFEELAETVECRKEIISRLKQLFEEKGVISKPIACILNEKEVKHPGNVDALSLGCSFFEKYKNVTDRLLIMACMNILSTFYENCYFQVNSFFLIRYIKKICALHIMCMPKKKVFFGAVEKNHDHLSQLFVEVAKSTSMVTIPRLKDVVQRLVSIEPDLRAVSVKYEAMFPWSHVLHNWCHSKLVSVVAQRLVEKLNVTVHQNEDEKKSEHEYKYQHENADDNENENKTRLDSHHKVLQSSNLLKMVMDGSENALKYLNMCSVKHCRMYLMDVITAKYNLNQQRKAEVIADILFCVISLFNWEVSVAMIESILYILPDFFAKYVKLLKLCQDDTGIVLKLHKLLDDENESTRLSGSICLLLQHFISFSPGLFLFCFAFIKISLKSYLSFFIRCNYLFAENKWSDIARSLEAVEDAIPAILQFAKDWYGNCKEYEEIFAMCRRAQMQILGAKHFERQIVDKVELSNVLLNAMSLSEDGWLNEKSTITTILERVSKEGNLLEKLDTPNKKTVYCSVITDIFHNAHDLAPDAKHVTDKIRLQILEELVQNQWNDETFTLDTHEAVLLNRILERIYTNTPSIKYNGPNQDIADISNVKAKLFQCVDSILSITKTLKISEMMDNQELNTMVKQASELLTHFNQSNKFHQYSLHIWFLRQFYIAKGMDWTQMLFTNEAIRAKYPIFVDPQMSNVFSVFKYRPPNLPSTDPFIGVFGDKYTNFRNKVLQGIKSGDVDAQYNGNKNDFIPLLGAALSLSNLCGTAFNENFTKVKDYLLQCNVLNFDIELNFVKILLSRQLSQTASGLRLAYNSDASDVHIPRLCFHFLGALQIMHKNPFQMLILNPKEYVNGHLPAMPENLLINMIRAMKKGGIEGNTFTVRYCPNMHPFIINRCGHPIEKISCAVDGCGKEIGDTTHVSQNTGLKLEIPKGYILDGSEDELSVGDSFWRYEGLTEVRRIYEVACTLMRLLLHLALLIRNAAVSEGCSQLQKLLQKTDAAKEKITCLNDELLSVALHQLLNDLPQTFNQWYPNGLNGTDLTTTYEFEKKFESQYRGFFSQTARFNELNRRSKINVDEEKKQRIDKSYREQYIPHLFLTIHKVSFDDLAQRFMTEPSLKSKHPLLYHVMCAKDELWSVKYLPVIGQWMKHVYFHFSRQISQQECQSKTIAQAIEEWKQKGYGSEVESYQQLWNGFKTCWNTLANRKVKNDCKSFVISKLHEDNSISLEFSTAQNNENGLIIVKIIQLLQDANNAFLEDIMVESKMRANNEEKYDAKDEDSNQMHTVMGKNKPLFGIHENDIVCLDKDQVTEIIQQWSLPSLEYGAINQNRNNILDLSAIENEIAYRFIKNRDILEVGIPFFQFSNQLNIKTCVAVIEENNKELKTEPIDQPLLKIFLSSLKSQSEIQRALEILNEVLVFVSQNIKTIDLDKQFVELLEQMSFDEESCKRFMMNFEEQQKGFILCRHMCNLWRLLYNAVQLEFVDGSTIDNDVLDIYKVPLTELLKQQLQEMVKKTHLGIVKQILEAWREVVKGQGQIMRDLKKKEPFGNWLNNVMFFDNELEFFPKESLTWDYCATSYAYLYELFKRDSGN
ncbi:RING finger protein [Reticulomyxa filosa]|uniref:RING finger protein n=1 Tax=Reticulomyxa filosa TaxID=46433 RepID=X6LGA5_RETFI|nr:RING finger protein [Reticulomyxa filosa]|eukprot:ETO01018.1 RING finger protein [Reticulomyxa filosa]